MAAEKLIDSLARNRTSRGSWIDPARRRRCLGYLNVQTRSTNRARAFSPYHMM